LRIGELEVDEGVRVIDGEGFVEADGFHGGLRGSIRCEELASGCWEGEEREKERERPHPNPLP
jgi:hypothetical protein